MTFRTAFHQSRTWTMPKKYPLAFRPKVLATQVQQMDPWQPSLEGNFHRFAPRLVHTKCRRLFTRATLD